MLLLAAKVIAAGLAVSALRGAYFGLFDIEDVILAAILLLLSALVLSFFFGIPPFMNKTESEEYLKELRSSYERHGGTNMTRTEYEAWWALWCCQKHNKDTKKKD